MDNNYYKVILKGLRNFHKNNLSLTFRQLSINSEFQNLFTQNILNSSTYQSKTRFFQNIKSVQFLGNYEKYIEFVGYKILLFITNEKERGAFLFGVLKNKREQLIGCWSLNAAPSSCSSDYMELHFSNLSNEQDVYEKIIIIS